MTVYIILGIILFIFSFIRKKWPLPITFLMLFIVVCFRDMSVGTDTLNYNGLFDSYGEDVGSMVHASEPLYLLIQLSVAVLGWDFNSMMFITSAIVIIGIYLYAIKASRRPNMVILCFYLLYYYFYAINTVRQYDAMVFVLFAWYFQKRRKFKLYFLFIAIACCFHNTAIIALISLIFEKVRISRKMMIVSLLSTFVIGLLPLVQLFFVLIGKFVNFPMLHYLADTSFGINFSPTRFLLTLYCAILVYLLRARTMEFKLLTIGICFMNIFAFNPEAARIAQYFTIIQIVIIPYIPRLTRHKKKAVTLTTLSMVYMLSVWGFLIGNNIGEVVPYEFGTFHIFGF